MTSGQLFPTLSETIDPLQMCSDVAPGLASTDWYTPGSYAYNDPFITPYVSSAAENQPWVSYTRASVPDISSYASHHHHQQQQQQQAQHQQHPPQFKDFSRPRSSPSTFGPSLDAIPWPSTTVLGINYPGAAVQPTPGTSTFPPAAFQAYPMEEHYSTSSPPELRQPQPRRPYTIIAPNPAGVTAQKRRREADEDQSPEAGGSTKRRKRTSSVASADLSQDDRFLVQLKEDEGLPWKDIATRFQTDRGKNLQVAALQMRYKRLREKFRIWEEQDVNALRQAHEYWEKYKWEIISAKMLEYGLSERWPARHCARKWQELEVTAATQTTTTANASAMSQLCSPTEAPVHFAFMPLH